MEGPACRRIQACSRHRNRFGHRQRPAVCRASADGNELLAAVATENDVEHRTRTNRGPELLPGVYKSGRGANKCIRRLPARDSFAQRSSLGAGVCANFELTACELVW